MQINIRHRAPRALTHEGAVARALPPELELRRSVLACLLWEQTFYESGVAIADRILDLVPKVDPLRVAALAIEARQTHHLRHVPLLLARELAAHAYGATAMVLAAVIQRPDELTEFLALYWRHGRCPLSRQVKLGLAAAFQRFDAYQLAKYDRPGTVRLRDVMFLTHPKPRNEQQAKDWAELASGTLASPDTWEVALSAGAEARATWTRLLEEGRLGDLALLRNLRNMIAAGVDDALIRRGLLAGRYQRVLPFRFLSAARHAPRFEPELEHLMLASLADAPQLPGHTVLVVDRSESMNDRLSKHSELTRFDAAATLAMLLRELAERVTVFVYSSPWFGAVDHVQLIPARRGFALRAAMGEPAGGTYTEDGKQAADRLGYDRIIVITDEQSHQALSTPRGRGYVVNVGAYRHGIGYGAWTHIDGWSEAVVAYIQAIEAER